MEAMAVRNEAGVGKKNKGILEGTMGNGAEKRGRRRHAILPKASKMDDARSDLMWATGLDRVNKCDGDYPPRHGQFDQRSSMIKFIFFELGWFIGGLAHMQERIVHNWTFTCALFLTWC